MPHAITPFALAALACDIHANLYMHRIWFPDEDDEPLFLYRELTEKKHICEETYAKIKQDLDSGRDVILVNGINTFIAAATAIGLKTNVIHALTDMVETDFTLLVKSPIPMTKRYTELFDGEFEVVGAKNAISWIKTVLTGQGGS